MAWRRLLCMSAADLHVLTTAVLEGVTLADALGTVCIKATVDEGMIEFKASLSTLSISSMM
jgi:hypothetical protein